MKRILRVLLAAMLLLALAACKTEEEPTITTFADVPGVAIVPEDFWDEVLATAETTVPEETENAVEETEKATEPQETEEEPSDGEQESTKPADTSKPTEPAAKVTEYEWFNALSGEEQEAYMETFDSIAAFFDWYNAAKAEYEALYPSIDIGDANIDIGDIIGGNG